MQPWREYEFEWLCHCGRKVRFFWVSPVHFPTGGSTGATGEKSLPRFQSASPPLGGTGDRGKPSPPVASPDGGNAGFPGPPLGGDAHGLDRVQPTTTVDELKEARQALAYWSNEVAAVDAELGPAKQAERQIRDRIKRTHVTILDDRNETIVDPQGFRLDGAFRRKSLFAELDTWTAEWGPVRAKRAKLAVEMKIQQRHVKSLEDDLNREAQRKEKNRGRSGREPSGAPSR